MNKIMIDCKFAFKISLDEQLDPGDEGPCLLAGRGGLQVLQQRVQVLL